MLHNKLIKVKQIITNASYWLKKKEKKKKQLLNITGANMRRKLQVTPLKHFPYTESFTNRSP
jgi:hypothetical protein